MLYASWSGRGLADWSGRGVSFRKHPGGLDWPYSSASGARLTGTSPSNCRAGETMSLK
jgi:hypothetical protein